MGTTDRKSWYPDRNLSFRGADDMKAMQESNNVITPVVSLAERDALTPKATKDNPILVHRTDIDAIESCDGTSWCRHSGPIDINLSDYLEAPVEYLPSADPYPIQSKTLTLTESRRLEVTQSFIYYSRVTGQAGAGEIVLLVNGVALPVFYRIHTLMGAVADLPKPFTARWTIRAPKGDVKLQASTRRVAGTGYMIGYKTLAVQG